MSSSVTRIFPILTTISRICAVCLLLVFAAGCKKNQLGGDATIQGDVVHHSKKIANASVFIKFDAKEFPGKDTTLYDSKVRADANGHYKFSTYKGDYYVYATGKDYETPPPYRVSGGTPVTIRSGESLEILVAVTED
jgi:hypothetical protein